MQNNAAILLSSFTDESLIKFHNILKNSILTSTVDLQEGLLTEALAVLVLRDQAAPKAKEFRE